MSYYILPKKHNTLANIDPTLVEISEENDESILKPVVSHSLLHYLNLVTEQIKFFF